MRRRVHPQPCSSVVDLLVSYWNLADFLFFLEWYGKVVCESGMRVFDYLSQGSFDCSLDQAHPKASLQVVYGPF